MRMPPAPSAMGSAKPTGAVVKLVFDLLPTSYEFSAGHSVRLSIAGVDADYFDHTESATTLRIHRGVEHPSGLTLPIRPRR